MGVAQKLKDLRKEKKLTQEQLAKELGLSKSAIIGYENGKREPNFEAMSKIEKYFGVSANYLKGESENNDYNDIRSELFESLAFLITDFEHFNKFINKYPQEEQLEAFSFLDISIDLLINEDIENKDMFDYFSILNEFILNIHRFKQFLKQSSNNKNQINIKRMIDKFSRPYIKYLTNLSKLYGYSE